MSSQIENTIKCLSLTQPWSTLVVTGAKKIETRSWKTSYRGLLGIHAARGFPWDAQTLVNENPMFQNAIHAGLLRFPSQMFPGRHSLQGRKVCASDLPVGALLGTVQLIDIVPVEYVRPTISSDEYAFGDYSGGRWAWKLEDPRLFKEPIVMKGALGLWSADMRLVESEVRG